MPLESHKFHPDSFGRGDFGGRSRNPVCEVTTLDQNEQRKLGGQALDWIFSDKASGICTLRPQLAELLRSARDADIVALGELRVWQAEPGAKSNAWGPP